MNHSLSNACKPRTPPLAHSSPASAVQAQCLHYSECFNLAKYCLLSLDDYAESSPRIPALQKWRHRGQTFKVISDYRASMFSVSPGSLRLSQKEKGKYSMKSAGNIKFTSSRQTDTQTQRHAGRQTDRLEKPVTLCVLKCACGPARWLSK